MPDEPIQFQEKPHEDKEILHILHPLIRKWFTSKFREFAPPQKYSIINIHQRENTLVSSPTGSGKTLSAFLAILNELVDLSEKKILEDRVYCIYISPLKALANDIERNLNGPLNEMNALAEMEGKSINVRVGIRTGDTLTKEKVAMLKKPPHILITTPESFAIILSTLKFREKIMKVEWVIVDEIHALADSKRGSHLSLSLERLEYLTPYCRIGLSATVSPLESVARFLVGIENPDLGLSRPCKIVDVQYLKKLDLKVLSPVKNLIGTSYEDTHKELYNILDDLIQSHKTTLIFTNTRSATERVVHFLKEKFPKHYIKMQVKGEEEEVKNESVHTNHPEGGSPRLAMQASAGDDGTDSKTLTNDNTTGKTLNVDDGDFSDEETEAALKIEIPLAEPDTEISYIGAHHGSLSKDHRLMIEQQLKDGKLKCVVSSTSLELGIDIGYIDLVILLGSPKSVARALQRIGRSGHQLHETAVGRIVVLDRDDLVECGVLLKAAIEKKIDRIDIPNCPLDVLAQQIFGIALEDQPRNIDELYFMIKKSYTYRHLNRKEYDDTLLYLSGEYASLEDRNVYAKIWIDTDTGMMGKKGKLARMIYMTNIGTIPDESGVRVKVGDKVIGIIDENFLEKLKRGDIFVLGGSVYEFLYSQSMTAFVRASVSRPPTVPSWFSEQLPLSFDLAMEISKFRRYMEEMFESKASKDHLLNFIHSYLYVDDNAAVSIYEYFREQFMYCEIPHDKKIIIEHYSEGSNRYIIFHTVFGRRVNDVLSRAVGFAIGKVLKRDVEINISDNGFYVLTKENIPVIRIVRMIKSKDLRKLMELALDRTEVLQRRFRHSAGRGLMILRNYKGKKKSVSKQAQNSRLLISAVKKINVDFPILKEARREVLEDLMDIEHAKEIVEGIEEEKIDLKEVFTQIPSPFAFNLITMGYTDIMKMEDKIEFLKRMHDMVLAKIALKEAREGKSE